MSNLDYWKWSKTKSCVTKINGFWPSTLVKDFHLRGLCDSHRYGYDSIVKPILKIKI